MWNPVRKKRKSVSFVSSRLREVEARSTIPELSGSERYVMLPGETYSFYFKDSRESYELVRQNLKRGGKLKKRLASYILPYLKYIPFFSAELPSSESFPGDVVRDGPRTKCFDLENGRVYSLDCSEEEAGILQDLEERGIRYPEVTGQEDEVLVEKYMDFEKYESFDSDTVEVVADAVLQLVDYYRSGEIEYRNSSEIVDGLEEDREVREVDSHGDFHIGNLGVFEDEVYVLDWEGSSRNFLMFDWVFFLVQEYRYSGDPEYFRETEEQNYSEELERVYSIYREKFDLENDDIRFQMRLFLEWLKQNNDRRLAEEIMEKIY